MPIRNFIYCLLDPVDGAPRYVGMSLYPEQRLKEHIAAARRKPMSSQLWKWLAALDQGGRRPLLMRLVEVNCMQVGYEPGPRVCGCGRWCRLSLSAERQWITWFRDEGHDLFNRT